MHLAGAYTLVLGGLAAGRGEGMEVCTSPPQALSPCVSIFSSGCSFVSFRTSQSLEL